MDQSKKIPVRKHPRLEHYDYSSAGAYFITICTQDRQCVLSHIIPTVPPVGRGLAPAASSVPPVGRGFTPADSPAVQYTPFGKIAETQLLLLKKRYPFLTIAQYVIMPNHIHVIMILDDTAGASPRPTIMDIVCAFKSLTTRECKKNGFFGKLFQTSFYEHVIRNRNDYDEIAKYIHENPAQWCNDKLYVTP